MREDKSNGNNPQISSVGELCNRSKPLAIVRLRLAFNKDTPDDIINLWQGTYGGLVKEGVAKSIFQKHGLESLYPAFQ